MRQPRSQAAQIEAVGLQTVRDWAMAFNAAGPTGLIDREPPGNAPELGEARRQALAQVSEAGPDPERHGAVRWRPRDLAAWIHSTFGISLDEGTVGHTAKELGFASLSARRRRHEQDPAALTASKQPAGRRSNRARRLAAARCSRSSDDGA